MNRINCIGIEVINLKKIPGSRADYAMKQVLDYVAGQLEHDYRTPDDVTFQFKLDATLNNKGYPNIKVVATFIPRVVIDKRYSLGKKRPNLCLDMHYRTDVEMTEKLYCDIMKLLSHLGKSALYNNTSEQIYAMRGEVIDPTSPQNSNEKVYRPL